MTFRMCALSSSLTKSRKVSRTRSSVAIRSWIWSRMPPVNNRSMAMGGHRWLFLEAIGASGRINQRACGQQIIHFAVHGKLPIGLICGRCSTK